jgi:hypothetical protein
MIWEGGGACAWGFTPRRTDWLSEDKWFRIGYNSHVSYVTPCLFCTFMIDAAHAPYSSSQSCGVCSWLHCCSPSICCLILQHFHWRELPNFVFVVALHSSRYETDIILCGFIKGTVEKYTSRGHLRTGAWVYAIQNFTRRVIPALIDIHVAE